VLEADGGVMFAHGADLAVVNPRLARIGSTVRKRVERAWSDYAGDGDWMPPEQALCNVKREK
jgi:hypothetical protein